MFSPLSSLLSWSSSDWHGQDMPWLEEEHKKRVVQKEEESEFDADEKVEAIHQHLDSAEPVEQSCQKLVELLGTASVSQRQNLKQKYAAKFGGLDLKEQLIKHLPFSELITRELLEALTDTPAEHDAKYLQKAMQGFGTDEQMLIELLVSRSNKQLMAIKVAYKALFDRELASEVIAETSGTFKALLLDLLEANRDESYTIDEEKAKKDAAALYKAGEGRLGTNEKVFIELLANQNLRQLRLLFDEYEQIAKHPIEKAIQSEFSRDTLRAFLALVEFVRNGPVAQVAKLTQKCIEGNANEELLVHLIYTYKELNLLSILADEYHQKFKGPLVQAIQNSAKSALLKNALVFLVKRAVSAGRE